MNRHASTRNRERAELEEATIEINRVLMLDVEGFGAATRAATAIRAYAERIVQAAVEMQSIGVKGARRANLGHDAAVILGGRLGRLAEEWEAPTAA